MDKKNIMDYETVLPEDFDGTFRFTNPSKEDFIGTWDGEEYLFPAESTVPMVMPRFSPLEIQHIRKRFAQKLAEREFYKSENYEMLRGAEGTFGNRALSSFQQANSYDIEMLTPYIQKCLEPMKEAKLTAKKMDKPKVEDKLAKDEHGEPYTTVIDEKVDLKKLARG